MSLRLIILLLALGLLAACDKEQQPSSIADAGKRLDAWLSEQA